MFDSLRTLKVHHCLPLSTILVGDNRKLKLEAYFEVLYPLEAYFEVLYPLWVVDSLRALKVHNFFP